MRREARRPLLVGTVIIVFPKKTSAKVWRLEGQMEPQEGRGQHSVLLRQARQVVKAKSLGGVYLLVALRPRQDI